MSASEAVLETRVLELERRCRKMSLGLMGLGEAMLTACLSAAVSSTSDEVRARDFVLVGPDAKERGRWGADETGTTLWLQNAQGSAHLVLSSSKMEPSESLFGFAVDDGGSSRTMEIPNEEEKTTSGPWAGVHAWTEDGDEETARVLLGTPGNADARGLIIEHDDSNALIAVGEGVLMLFEDGADPGGVASLLASHAGSALDVSWGDECAVTVKCDDKESRLQMSTDVGGAGAAGEEPVHKKPILELTSTGDAGSIRVHDGDEVIFETP